MQKTICSCESFAVPNVAKGLAGLVHLWRLGAAWPGRWWHIIGFRVLESHGSEGFCEDTHLVYLQFPYLEYEWIWYESVHGSKLCQGTLRNYQQRCKTHQVCFPDLAYPVDRCRQGMTATWTISSVLRDAPCEGVVAFIAGLQQEDGSFAGDRWGEAGWTDAW